MSAIVQKFKNGVLVKETTIPVKQEKKSNAPKRKSKEDKPLQEEDTKPAKETSPSPEE